MLGGSYNELPIFYGEILKCINVIIGVIGSNLKYKVCFVILINCEGEI